MLKLSTNEGARFSRAAVLIAMIGATIFAGGSSGDYPGSRSDASMDLAFSWIEAGAQQYCAMTGTFPAAWTEVVSSGLVQAQLETPAGQAIDPDDGQLDFAGDLCYVRQDADTALIIYTVPTGSGFRHANLQLKGKTSYVDVLRVFDQTIGTDNAELAGVQELKLMAIAGMFHQMARDYQWVHGEFPATLHDLLESGIGPLDLKSINPITGQAFIGDGREWDVKYKVASNGNSVQIDPVFEDLVMIDGRYTW
jgi:hypothetical protein